MAKTEILIEDPSLEYELNEDDIIEYAKQIGIDVQNEKYLMWIAKEGLAANVPGPWLILSDERDRIFYSNFKTGEKSWFHPLDKEYAALVIQERRKCLNSPSSDCGFESKNPLNPILDGSQSPGRFPKAPLPQLSSLSDAPPLSSSGKTTPSSLKPSSNSNTLSERKLELGRFENRRGAQLAPVRLNTLKMPVPAASPKPSSGMSFMPKGSSLSRNIRRVPEEQDLSGNQFGGIRNQIALPQEDFNEGLNSDEGSKYSYEETDEDMEKSYDDINQSDVGSHFSPPHSAIDSPEALDINSLVQLGTKFPSRLESAKKMPKLQTLNEDQSPSLNLRKTGQPSYLKPLQQASKKKTTPKKSKKSKKASDLNNQYEYNDTEEDFDSKIAALNEEQRLRFESIQKEWAAMLEELGKQEKTKYDQMVNESNKKFAEEESVIRKENSEKLSILKKELMKKLEEEENSGQINLAEIRQTNEQKIVEEEQKFKQKLESLTDTLKSEVEKMEQKNAEEVIEKKKQLDEESKKEIEDLKSLLQNDIKKLKETHASELALLEKAHQEKVVQLQTTHSKEEEGDGVKPLVKEDESSTADQMHVELKKLKESLKDEKEKYQKMLNELQKLKVDIAAEKEVLLKLEEKSTSAQTYYEEIQDEVDKTENDLDLLRNEKSALISELNILKENINNEKSKLLKDRKSVSSPSKKANFAHKELNTDTYSMLNQPTQTSIEVHDVSCQIREVETTKMDRYSQTNMETKSKTTDVSCQVEILKMSAITNDKQSNEAQSEVVNTEIGTGSCNANPATVAFAKHAANENINLDVLVNKVMENALIGISNKIEARLKLIEEQLSSAQNDPDSSHQKTTDLDSSSKNVSTQVKEVSNIYHQNGYNSGNDNSAINNATFIKTALSNSNNCGCEQGDVDSCKIMQDVKNSIHRLNDILSPSFVPSFGNAVISSFNYPTNNYSSTLQSFYSQFRQLQEKQRITELKHKLQNESTNKQSRSFNRTDQNYFHGSTNREFFSFNRALSSSHTTNLSDDPVSRARNLVLREQARSWKQQQQYLNTSDTQGFLPLERNYNASVSDNISPTTSSRISPGLSEHSHAFQFPFLKFEPDPETEYNEWMTRLKTLQDKIRSHKLL